MPPDLWSAAYREAVESLGEDIDVAILKGSNAAQLFKQLEEVDKDVIQESAFLRGVAFLRSIQVPLERFKLALDLASPVSNLEPAAATVFGVVKSVTAIAITFASADLEFAKQIGEMLEQLSYIDDCDTLGQRANRQDIHKALVSVYQKVLEFYQAAHEILTRRGAKLVMTMVLETDRLPNVVHDFLRHADTLRKLIEKATWEVTEDIKGMLYDQEIDRWLGCSKVSLQTQYHADLQELRTDEACTFLLMHPDFRKWYGACDSEWLVIFGEMGSGKTNAMAFIVDELSQRNEHQLPQPKICYHYCRNDETGQVGYIFAALILALLEQLPGLKKTFHAWYKEKQASGVPDPVKNTRELGRFFKNVTETLDRPLFIVVDGLDECDRASRETLLKSLRTLSQKTPRLKILLSSRPERGILEHLADIPRINMSSDEQRDATIVRHSVDSQLSYLSEDVRALVVKRLSSSAQGSAIWTKMMVELIGIRRIEAFEPMRRFLKEMPLPDQLSELYISMVARYCSDDSENKKLVAIALKVLTAACRPLSIQELAWAVALAAGRHEVSTIADLAQLVDHQRVMSLIHPFIARTDLNDLRKRQIRLVHQSVKEFVIRDWPLLEKSATPTALTSMNADHQIEMLESFLLDICIDYLLLDEVGSFQLFSDAQIAIDELPQEADLFENTESAEYDPSCTWEAWEENMVRYDPAERGFGHFFVYAASQWLRHLSSVRSGSLPQLTKIESLCQAGSIRLHNWIRQNCRPDCAIKARFEFDSHLYDPLSIASLYGSDAMLCDMLENSNFDKDNFLPLPAIAAADQILQWGNLSRLRTLFLEYKFVHQLHNLDFFRLITRRWSEIGARHNDWNVAFDLVDIVSSRLVQEKWGSELLCMAARAGCMPLIQHLLNAAQHDSELKAELLRGSQSIADAVLGDHVHVVQCLLEQEGFEAHLGYLNNRGENVLHLASKNCNPSILRILVPHFRKRMDQTDGQGQTALLRVIKSNSGTRHRYESAKLLLLSQTSADSVDPSQNEQHGPLRLAVQLGDIDMCRLLIYDGRFNPNSALTRGNDGLMVLKDKPRINGEAILRLLQKPAQSME
ncbi:hypothetical protein LTR64_008794 [Lithohypha guttulata]|uniref:uncharacterized protein n=1 Tax=Lithohypha guttulata TaxID=1690604 RepID=UPI00315C5900